MREGKYKTILIHRIRQRFPGCIIFKNDPNHLQGVPDLLILYGDRWAALEVKDSVNAARQPNQEYYISEMDGMSFAAFICPENEEDVLNDLQQTFEPYRAARISRR